MTFTGIAKAAMDTGRISPAALPRRMWITAAFSFPIRARPTAVHTLTSARLWSSCMGTSKSPKAWEAGALWYAGRGDPNWTVREGLARQLQKLWNKMPPLSGPAPDVPGLGYRGAFLRGPGGREWVAFNGVVSLK